MKRLLGTVIAVALLVSPGLGSAEILKNFKVGGTLDLQTVSARNVTDFSTYTNDRIGTAMMRVMVNADWDLLDDVHAVATLRKNDHAWGGNPVAAGGQQQTNGSQSLLTQGNGVLGNFFVDQAKVKIDKVFGAVDTTIGRQFFGDPGDLVIRFGPTDAYGLYTWAIDAVSANYSNDMLDITGMAGRIGNATFGYAGNIGTLAQQDMDVHGLEAWFKGLPLKTGAFVWRRVQHNSTAAGYPSVALPNDYLWVYGLKLRGEAAGGWFQADAAFNAGNATTIGGGAPGRGNYVGKAFLVKAGYKAELPNVGGFTPWGNFGWGSGRSDSGLSRNDQFQSIFSDYRPGIINRRFNTMGPAATVLGVNTTNGGVSTVGLGNRVLWGAGVNFTPAAAEKLTVGGEVWDYRFQRTDASQFGNLGNTWTRARGNKHIGTEWGFTATWKHSENVLLDAGYAGFQPGGYIKNSQYNSAAPGGIDVSPVRMMFADVGIKF